jgi:NAD(P)-dependent dehydrogenase (short-subunit alcohol dehydrogenase family)
MANKNPTTHRKSSDQGDLSNKIALITGGSTGIGFATAKLFLNEGAKVVIISKNETRLSDAADQLKQIDSSRVLPIQCDVRIEDDIKKSFKKIINHFGRLDIVVNNAGITYSASIEDTTLEIWDNLNAVNNTGFFLVAREAYKIFKAQEHGGVFVFVASDNSLKPSRNSVAYNVSKAAELHLSRTIAAEGGRYKIRSNCVLPGAVFGISNLWTQEYRAARAGVHGFDPDKLEEEYKKANSLGVIIYPEEVAEVILFLAGEKSAKMTGNALVIDGGAVGSYVR